MAGKSALPLLAMVGIAAVALKKKKPKKANGAATWKERQRALAMMGYYSGPIDGVLDDDMRFAVMNFQIANLVPPSGEWNSSTEAALAIALKKHAAGISGADTLIVASNGGETITVGKLWDRDILGKFLAQEYRSGKLLSTIGAQTAYSKLMGTVYASLDGKPVRLGDLPQTDAVKAFNTSVFEKISSVRDLAAQVQEKRAQLGGAETKMWFDQMARGVPIVGNIWVDVSRAWEQFFGKE